jgi:hypothetical protein
MLRLHPFSVKGRREHYGLRIFTGKRLCNRISLVSWGGTLEHLLQLPLKLIVRRNFRAVLRGCLMLFFRYCLWTLLLLLGGLSGINLVVGL